jgi:predicted  nucleic acid-binding Zn-ribbon protein
MTWPPFIFLVLVGTAVITVLHHYQHQSDNRTSEAHNERIKKNRRKKRFHSSTRSETDDRNSPNGLCEGQRYEKQQPYRMDSRDEQNGPMAASDSGFSDKNKNEDNQLPALVTDQGMRNRWNSRSAYSYRKTNGHELNITVDEWRGSPSDDEVEDEKEKRSFHPFETGHSKPAVTQVETSISPKLEKFSPVRQQLLEERNHSEIVPTTLVDQSLNTHGDWMDSLLLRDSTDTVTYSIYDGTASKKASLDENQVTMFENPMASKPKAIHKEPSILVPLDADTGEFDKQLSEYREKAINVGNTWNKTDGANRKETDGLDQIYLSSSPNEDKSSADKQDSGNFTKQTTETDDIGTDSFVQKTDLIISQNQLQKYNPDLNISMNSNSFEFELPSDAPLLTFDALDNHNHLHHNHHHSNITTDRSSAGNTVPIRAPSLLIPSTSLERDSEINKRFFSNPFPSSSNSSTVPTPVPNLAVVSVGFPSHCSSAGGDFPSAHSGDEGVNSGSSSVASKTSRTSRSSFHSYSSNKINPFFSTPSPSPSSATGEQQKISRSTMSYIQQLDTFIRNRTDFYAPGYYYNIVLLFENVKPPKSFRFNNKKIGNVKEFISFLRKLPDYFHVSSDHKSVELVQLTPVSFIFSSNPSFSSLVPSFSGSGSSAEGEEYHQAIRRSGSSASSLRGSFSFGDIKGQAINLLEEDDENSTIATETLPVFVSDQMTPQVSMDQPLFGSFHCVNKYCYKRWNSTCSFPNVAQICPKCGIKVFPYSQRAVQFDDRDYNDSEDEGKIPAEGKNEKKNDAVKRTAKVSPVPTAETKSKETRRRSSLKDLKSDDKTDVTRKKEKARNTSKPKKHVAALPSELKVGLKPMELEGDVDAEGEDAIFRKVDSLDSYYEHPHDLEVNSVASGSSGLSSVHSSY